MMMILTVWLCVHIWQYFGCLDFHDCEKDKNSSSKQKLIYSLMVAKQLYIFMGFVHSIWRKAMSWHAEN